MRINLVGPFVVNAPFGTEIAFAKGLRRLGHEVIEIDPNVTTLNIISQYPDTDATVVFKSCVGNEQVMLDGHRSRPLVVYQPDDARFPHILGMMLMMRKWSDLFLSFDDHGASVARNMGYRAAETLLLTADDELYCPSPEPIERDIDVSFIGSMGDAVAHASRRKMCSLVQAEADIRGWKTAFGTTQDIPTILDIYRRSKVVLNHATDVGQAFGSGFGLQCRHFEVGMTDTCLLSNRLLNDIPGRPQFVTFDSEESLLKELDMLLNWGRVSYVGGRHEIPFWCESALALGSDVMWSHRPEHRARQLVDFIERNS